MCVSPGREGHPSQAAHTSPMVNPICLARTIISIWKTYPLETHFSISFCKTSFLYNLQTVSKEMKPAARFLEFRNPDSVWESELQSLSSLLFIQLSNEVMGAAVLAI